VGLLRRAPFASEVRDRTVSQRASSSKRHKTKAQQTADATQRSRAVLDSSSKQNSFVLAADVARFMLRFKKHSSQVRTAQDRNLPTLRLTVVDDFR
jgi:hypothetical protein